MCYEDGDFPEFFSYSWNRARKEHKCCECRRKIEKGSKYFRQSGKWDGKIETFKTCKECCDLSDFFKKKTGCEAPLGMLHEEIIEHEVIFISDEDEEDEDGNDISKWVISSDYENNIKITSQTPLTIELIKP